MPNFQTGQVVVGSHVETAPWIFTQSLTSQKIPSASGTSPTVATVTAGAGTGASVSAVTGYDQAGNFTVTAGTSPAAGTICTVTFGTPLAAAPSSVVVNASNTKAGAAAGITVGAIGLSKSGFAVFGNTAGSLSATYLINYQVIQ